MTTSKSQEMRSATSIIRGNAVPSGALGSNSASGWKVPLDIDALANAEHDELGGSSAYCVAPRSLKAFHAHERKSVVERGPSSIYGWLAGAIHNTLKA